MEKHEIIVPKGIRFVGEIDPETKRNKWKEYDIWNYDFPHILNKELTGCGYTEYCLNCIHPVVLISPRRFLLKNKLDQHPGDVYYFQNDDEVSTDYELDVGDDKKGIKDKAKMMEEGKNKTIKNLDDLKSSFRAAIKAHRMCTPYKPIKILVTYDSFKHVKDCLQHLYYDEGNHKAGYENILDRFQIIVDEFQSIFIDARFKSDAEIELLKQLKGIQRVCFVSATPMLDHYLEMLDEFKDLPYYSLNWEKEDPGRVRKPNLDVKFTIRSLNDEAKAVIDSYKKGKFDTRLDKEGNLIESKEAVIYMNSVKGICQVIRTNMLHIDQVNILCAQTTDNRTKIRKAFNDVLRKETEESLKHPIVPKEYDVIGSIPLIGQQHKMFTLCTRTVYLGADFYSTNARTFIFSDANVDSLTVDVSMDLEQILGRQRLDINPWKNSADLYIKLQTSKTTEEEFEKELEKKKKNTEALLRSYSRSLEGDRHTLAEKYQRDARNSNYKSDYVAVNEHAGKDLVPVFNNLMLVAEKRTFEIQQIDYKDRFTIFNAFGGNTKFDYRRTKYDVDVSVFEAISKFPDKMRFLENKHILMPKEEFENFLSLLPNEFINYIKVLGFEEIRSCSYQRSRIIKRLSSKSSTKESMDNIKDDITNTFIVGEKYTKSFIKEKIRLIYESNGYGKTPKANDLEQYFELKPCQITNKETGKLDNGYKIIKTKI